jgi:hypothetical protein
MFIIKFYKDFSFVVPLQKHDDRKPKTRQTMLVGNAIKKDNEIYCL